MMSAALPPDEEARVAALRSTGLLDTDPEPEFDEIVELAALLCGAPIAVVSLVDSDRQWFKAKYGLQACGTPREHAFCAHAILEPDRPLCVQDALRDLRFADNPLVTGEPFLRSYHGVVLRDRTGQPLGTLCVIDRRPRRLGRRHLRGLEVLARQVEARIELRLARDEALAAARAKSAFLATMSHEIRTPLVGLLGTLEAVLHDGPPPRVGEDLEQALKSGRLLRGLLDSVLDLSRSEEACLRLDPRPVDLVALLEDTAGLHRACARSKGVELVLEVAPQVPRWVRLDGPRLTQVLGNLLGNAVKFTEQGQVRLRVQALDPEAASGPSRVRIEVQDTGPGIPARDRERVFQRFEQGANARGGTGVGLALARELLACMGAELRLADGPGANLVFELPLEAVPAEGGGPEPALEPLAGRILLVDDEPVNLRVGSRLLEQLGVRVRTAHGGEAALEAVREESFDVVLLDCFMDDLDGFEVARRMVELGLPARGCSLVAFTASPTEDVRSRALAAGMVRVLGKPVERRELHGVLAPLLAGSARRAG